jgi:hypothetical protein
MLDRNLVRKISIPIRIISGLDTQFNSSVLECTIELKPYLATKLMDSHTDKMVCVSKLDSMLILETQVSSECRVVSHMSWLEKTLSFLKELSCLMEIISSTLQFLLKC